MPAVKILDAGGDLMLSGSTENDVVAALKKYVGRGASVISPPTRIGSSWIAICTAPPVVQSADETTTLYFSDIVKASARQDAAALAGAGSAKYVDAGHSLLISGPTRASVVVMLESFVQRGSRVTSEVAQIGHSWVATCEKPEVGLSGCHVEEVGLKRLITGPSRAAVAAKIEELAHLGAVQIGEIEEIDDQWTALCDTGAPNSSGFRW